MRCERAKQKTTTRLRLQGSVTVARRSRRHSNRVLFPPFLTFTNFRFAFLLLVVITATQSLCQSAKLCMQPLITLSHPQPPKAVPTRSMLLSATCFLRPAPTHALPLLRHSPNLYSPLRASSWLLMRSYLFSTLHDLRSVESLVLAASSAGTFFY